MIFSSAVFLFIFLPVVFLLDRLFRGTKAKNALLLASSLIFYAFGQLRYLPLLLLSVALNYGCGLLAAGKRPRLGVWLAAAGGIGMLAVFKYADFLIGTGNRLLGLSLPLTGIALPVGISFFTFQGLSYVIDVYRDRTAVSRSFVKVLLYISFFPQLIAGPIVRYQTVEQEIRNRRENWDDAVYGTRRFIVGLAKKVLLANNMAKLAELVYTSGAQGLGTSAYWLGAVGYTLQIYFDFSGYSDMAIGLGRIFGFHFLENFNYPYLSRSVTEFWRRWHISLSTWFRDYVYIPLGGNRVRRGRWVLNILVVWALTGLWHGAEWNFVLWGLYYAVFLLLEKFFLGRILERLPSAVQWLYAMFLTVVGWVLFNLTDFSQLAAALHTMFVYTPTDWFQVLQADTTVFGAALFLPFAILFSLPVAARVRAPDRTVPGALLVNLGYLALLAFCILYVVSSSFNPFIYFRF
ncbi:MAG: MBOAT family protein [Clostridiales bacterium]|nr:MBOAT family protein [Clostridiales bacterium]